MSMHDGPVSGHDHALSRTMAAQLIGDPEERDRAHGRHADLHRERGLAGDAASPIAGHRVVLRVAAHRVRADAADRHLGVRAGVPVRRRAVDRARDPVDARRPRGGGGGRVLGAGRRGGLARSRQRDRRLLVVDRYGPAIGDRVASRVRRAQCQGLRTLAIALGHHRIAGGRGIALVPHPRALGRAAARQRLAAKRRVHRAQARWRVAREAERPGPADPAAGLPKPDADIDGPTVSWTPSTISLTEMRPRPASSATPRLATHEQEAEVVRRHRTHPHAGLVCRDLLSFRRPSRNRRRTGHSCRDSHPIEDRAPGGIAAPTISRPAGATACQTPPDPVNRAPGRPI